ncbi:MAG: plastocyanin/azurin family copper-binding protein [Patescibacteria group bacterium]
MKKAIFPIIIVLAIAIGLGYWWMMTKVPSSPKPVAPTQTSQQQNGDSSLPSDATTVSTSPSTSTPTDVGTAAPTNVGIQTGTATPPAPTAQHPTPTQPQQPLPTDTTTVSNQKLALPTIEYVNISNMAFSPAIVGIKKGTVVKWSNDDSVVHTVTEDNGAFNSPALNPTDGFTFTFSEVGTYNYHCSIHPSMKGTVKVTE